MTWGSNLHELLLHWRLICWCCLLASMLPVGYAVVTSYGRILMQTPPKSFTSVEKWLLLNVLLPVFRVIDEATFASAALNRVVISLISVVLLIMALIARAYALVRR